MSHPGARSTSPAAETSVELAAAQRQLPRDLPCGRGGYDRHVCPRCGASLRLNGVHTRTLASGAQTRESTRPHGEVPRAAGRGRQVPVTRPGLAVPSPQPGGRGHTPVSPIFPPSSPKPTRFLLMVLGPWMDRRGAKGAPSSWSCPHRLHWVVVAHTTGTATAPLWPLPSQAESFEPRPGARVGTEPRRPGGFPARGAMAGVQPALSATRQADVFTETELLELRGAWRRLGLKSP